jgi:hypothetical protein
MATEKDNSSLDSFDIARKIENEQKRRKRYIESEIDDTKELRDLEEEILRNKEKLYKLAEKSQDRSKQLIQSKENLENIKNEVLAKRQSLDTTRQLRDVQQQAFQESNEKYHKAFRRREGLTKSEIANLKSIRDSNEKLLKTTDGQINAAEESYKLKLDEVILAERNVKQNEEILDKINGMAEATKSQIAKQKEALRWKEKMLEISKSLKKVSDTITSPYLILSGLLLLARNRFVDLDKAAGDLRRTTGLNKTQTEELEASIKSLNIQYSRMGVELSDLNESAIALVNEFGILNKVSLANVDTVALLSKNLGVSNKNAAGFVAYMDRAGRLTKDQIQNMAGFAVKLAEASSIPLDKIMEDVAGASDEARAMTGGQVINLIKASAQARKLGVDLNRVASSARGLLNFNESISAELEASVLLGKNLSFMDARRLAFAGDLAGAQNEILNQLNKIGDFNSLNLLQQEALAKASGYSVSDLQKMIKQKEDFNNLSIEDRNNYERLMKMREEEVASSNFYKDEIERMKMQTSMDNLKNAMTTLKIAGAQVMLPLIEGLAKLIPYVTRAAEEVSELTGWMTDNKWKTGAIAVLAMGGAFALSTLSILKTGSAIKSLKSGLGGLLSGKGGELFGRGGSKAIESATSMADKAKPASGRGFESFMGSFSRGISHMGNKQFMFGVVGLALLGASIIPFAFSMKMFSDISWSDVGKGVVSLGALTLAAIGLGFVMKSGIGAAALIAGAVAIGLLGAALIPFGYAAGLAGSGMKSIAEALTSINPQLKELTLLNSQLFITADAISELGSSFAAFGVGQAAGGIGSFVGKLLGGSRITDLQKLADLGPKLQVTAEAIRTISNPEKDAKSESQTDASGVGMERVVEKLDQLIGLMKNGGIAVNMDGRRVTYLLANRLA